MPRLQINLAFPRGRQLRADDDGLVQPGCSPQANRRLSLWCQNHTALADVGVEGGGLATRAAAR